MDEIFWDERAGEQILQRVNKKSVEANRLKTIRLPRARGPGGAFLPPDPPDVKIVTQFPLL
jgi:hypothetical protein